ncbi:MAG TPA: 6-carboxytetrahydropterin synthase [Phycisphaerales bacterium]|nr:6-carboxytetrahydropterin synthase [Phycisphaerales bacterium]
MFELSIEATFCAAHSLRIGGRPEPVHGHNWHVTATLAGTGLDSDGLLVDFHVVERALASIVDPLNNADLNAHPAFASVNPSAEHVARYVATELAARLEAIVRGARGRVRLARLRVTEAPGCSITYHPPLPASTSPMSET